MHRAESIDLVFFEIDSNSQRYFKILAVKYGAIDLLTDIGSWAGLMLAAYIILWWYQWLAKPFGGKTKLGIGLDDLTCSCGYQLIPFI